MTRFLAAGYRVLVTVSPGRTMKESSKGEVEQFECDLTDEKSVDVVVQKMVAKYPVIDAALLLVGGFAMGDIAATDGASMKKMYSLNFETAYYVARPVFQHMMGHGQGGRIVFIGARPALEAKAGKGMIAYGLSKSLLFKLS